MVVGSCVENLKERTMEENVDVGSTGGKKRNK